MSYLGCEESKKLGKVCVFVDACGLLKWPRGRNVLGLVRNDEAQRAHCHALWFGGWTRKGAHIEYVLRVPSFSALVG